MKLWNKIVIIVFILLFSSVVNCTKETALPPPPIDPLDYVKPVSNEISVRIYFDATVSMIGFVDDKYSEYVQLLPSLADAVVRGWKKSKVDYYKFGSYVSPIGGNHSNSSSGYLLASEKEFYTDKKINLETNIQKVIDHSDPNGLNIIVTDLFQTDNDIVLLVNKLREKYLQKGLAIGLLGLKSRYKGTIYDVGVGKEKNYYEGFRPFYLVILGEYADIVQYFNKLRIAGAFYVSKDNFIIFSHHLVESPLSFDGARANFISGLRETNRLLPRDAPKDHRVKQFEAHVEKSQSSSRNIEMQFTFKYKGLDYAIPFRSNELECEVIANKNESRSGGGFSCHREKAEVELVPVDPRSLDIQTIKLSQKDLKFTARLEPSLLKGEGIYSYHIIIRPQTDAYEIPTWCQKWNMGITFDGSKTVNLNRFVGNLLESTIQARKPKIADFYCYIRK